MLVVYVDGILLSGGLNGVSLQEIKTKNLILQKEIERELECVEQGKSTRNKSELLCILKELRLAEDNLDYNFFFARAIIDSWDYSDKLGLDLMSLVSLYKKRK